MRLLVPVDPREEVSHFKSLDGRQKKDRRSLSCSTSEVSKKPHNAERGAKGFTCWAQLVAMLFCQMAHADSLREICNGLACSLGKLVHLGIGVAPNKSTLSYANRHRPAALYEDLFYTALGRFRDEQGLGMRKRRFRFKNKLLSLDSTTISLCLEMFPWAKFRRAKGGVKAHVLLDHDDYLPRYVLITEARRSDVKMAAAFPLNPGSIVVDGSRLQRLRACSASGPTRESISSRA